MKALEEYLTPGMLKGLAIHASKFVRPQEVEDIVQGALLCICKYFEQYKPKYAFSTWAYRIVQNEALRRKRDNARHNRLAPLVFLDEPRGRDPEGHPITLQIPTAHPEKTYNAKLDVGKALSVLTAKQRKRVMLHWGYELSYDVIRKLGIDSRNRHVLAEDDSRIRERARKFLEGQC